MKNSPHPAVCSVAASRGSWVGRIALLGVLVCVLGMAARSAYADETLPYSLSVRTSFGTFYGVADEYVYNQDLSPDYKNSQLVWPLEPMLFSGAALSFDSVWGIFAVLDVKQGFAGKAGEMTDSDFLNGDGQRTHFSQSDSYAERSNILDFKAGWDFLRIGPLRTGAFGEFTYMDLKWSARDGYYQYPTSGQPYSTSPFIPGTYTPWSDSETKTPLYGTGIIYETAYVGAAFGVRVRADFSSAFSVDGSFAFTPLLYCSTEDNHPLRQLDFYSSLSGGFMIEPRVGVEYGVLPRARLRLDVGYRYAWGLKGDLTVVNTGTSDFSTSYPLVAGPDSTVTFKNDSGADLSLLDASLMLSISL